MARLDVLDVPVLVLEVDALVVRDVVVNVVLIEVDVLVVRDMVVKDVLDVLLLEVDVLAVRDVVVEEVLDVLESLVVDVWARSRKTVPRTLTAKNTHGSGLSNGVCRMIFEGSKSNGLERFNEEQCILIPCISQYSLYTFRTAFMTMLVSNTEQQFSYPRGLLREKSLWMPHVNMT